jgi:glutamine cyclotransferase
MHYTCCSEVTKGVCCVAAQVGTFRTPLRDGWGITTVGKQMVLSDGSAQLTWVDQNFKKVKTVTVKDRTRSIGYLNEVGGGSK